MTNINNLEEILDSLPVPLEERTRHKICMLFMEYGIQEFANGIRDEISRKEIKDV